MQPGGVPARFGVRQSIESRRMTSGTESFALEDEARWAAVCRRDRTADGAFVYAVSTTGVYCRPACGARLPRRSNVRFYPDGAQARDAGYRPCRRCFPDDVPAAAKQAAAIADACRHLATDDSALPLQEVAARVGMSRYHFQRVFKAVTGVTPKAYRDMHRQQRIRHELARTPSVTSAIYEAGFSSSGRFYEHADRTLGMTPTAYRRRGQGLSIGFGVGRCSLGHVLVAATDRGVCAIMLGDDSAELERQLRDRFSAASRIVADDAMSQAVDAVAACVEHPARAIDLPLDIQGTVFQQRVWQALRDIRAGTTLTYSQLAQRLGLPRAVRAVAAACGANPVAVAIPCHRVVGSDGALRGYRWGPERKRALLALEANG